MLNSLLKNHLNIAKASMIRPLFVVSQSLKKSISSAITGSIDMQKY